jgi:GNAT superfamily N-acetyltransferase
MGIQVRRATVVDADEVASVHFHAWQAAVRGAVQETLLEQMSLVDGQLRWRTRLADGSGRQRTFVASDGASVGGFCRLRLPSPDADADAFTAQVASLYVLPDCWRRGFGTALLTAALESLEPEPWHEVTLWSLRVSERAQAFYAKHGFEPDGATDLDWRYDLHVLRLRRPLQTRSGPLTAAATSAR